MVVVDDYSGDRTVTPEDYWIISDDGTNPGGDPAVSQLMGNEDGVEKLDTFRRYSSDNFELIFDLTLEPGEIQSVLSYGIKSASRAAALANTRELHALHLGALDGLSSVERDQVVNWNLDDLQIEDTPALATVGGEGGPFYPAGFTIELCNRSSSNILNWTGSIDVDWLDLSATNGTLLTTGCDSLALSLNSNAFAFARGAYTATLSFINLATAKRFTREIHLFVSGPAGEIFFEDFETGGTNVAANGDWEFGRPLSGPLAGPASANVAGTRLDENYGNDQVSVIETTSLVLPVLPDSRCQLTLTYWEWFETEVTEDRAVLDIRRENDSSWTSLSTSSGSSGGWQFRRVDLRAYAGQTVDLRFQFTSDESARYEGWYIDDVRVEVSCPSPLEINVLNIDSLNFPFVYMNVTVETNGAPINTLPESHFSVWEDGVPQTNRFEVIPPTESGEIRLADIVFVMDNSGSMSEEQDAVEMNVSNFVARLTAAGVDVAFGLVRYGQTANGGDPIVEDNGILTTQPDYFVNDVWQRNVDAGATEPGYKSIVEALNTVAFRPGSQKIIIQISDETPRQGSVTEQEAIDAALGRAAIVFALTELEHFPDYIPIAAATEGDVYDIYDDFEEIFERISNRIGNTYLMRYRSSDPQATLNERVVTVGAQYEGEVGNDLIRYTPRSSPKVSRTDATLALHQRSHPPGSSIMIEILSIDHVPPHTQRVQLFYRPLNGGAFKSVYMGWVSGSIWRASIPASAVQAPGVDYFLIATDGESTSSDPSLEPNTRSYQLAVAPNDPPIITHTPVTAPADGLPMPITAIVTDQNNGLQSVALNYRKTGQLIYQATTLVNATGDAWTGGVPSDFVTFEGVDYYLLATDTFGVGQYHGTPDQPHQTFAPDIMISPLSLTVNLVSGQKETHLVRIASSLAGMGALNFEAVPATTSTLGVLTFFPVLGYLSDPGSFADLEVTFSAEGARWWNLPGGF